MDKNYFSDITELFIKAKKAENIDVNPHSKATIREMLAYKVDEIKASEATPKEGFFAKWKYQLVGVPASILAVFVVVVAFQNLQITMPRATEESSMERSEAENSEMSEANEADAEIEDTPVIKDIPIETKQPEPKPELLVIDYSETPTPTPTSTTTQPKTGGGSVPPASTQPAVAEIAEVTEVAEAPYVAPVIAPASTPTYIQPEKPAPPTNDGSYTMISDTNAETDPVPIPILTTPQYEINPDVVNNLMDGSIPLPKDPNEEESVNEFRDPFNPLVTEFDTEALNAIEKTDTLDNVNVHYLNKDQAAVEVITDDETRWYMFEDRGGTWTLTQKFD